MSQLFLILPILVVFVLLLSGRHMVFAGLVGMCLAFVIGNMTLETGNRIFLDALHRRFGIEVPLIYSSLAVMLFNAGCFRAVGELARHYGKGSRRLPMGLLIVALHGMATFLFGSASSMTTIFAPILFHLSGYRPGVVAALSIVSAVGFSISPASTETFITAHIAKRGILEHSFAMLPCAVGLYLLAFGFAIFGLRENESKINVAQNDEHEQKFDPSATWWQAIPVFTLLTLVLACRPLTNLGFTFLTPMSTLIVMIIVTTCCTEYDLGTACQEFLTGSMKVAEKLFSIGLFLGFLGIIGEAGSCASLLAGADRISSSFVLPIVMTIAFFMAIPVGAHCSAVLMILLPQVVLLHPLSQNISSESLGLITLATAMGAHLSPIQVNITGLGSKFEVTAFQVIRGNIPYIVITMLALLSYAFLSN